MGRFDLRKVQNIQDFIWIAQYMDGSILSEFDLQSGQEHPFYAINRDYLRSFGLYSGAGADMYFDVPTGMFFIMGRLYEFIFKTDSEEYYLTGSQQRYQDIITYKDAEAVFSPFGGRPPRNGIVQYNFGYKTLLNFKDGTQISYKAILHIPYGKPTYFTIRLVSNKPLKGSLLVKRQGQVVDFFPGELSPELAGEINITVR